MTRVATDLATRSAVAHLLRRAGFGAHADDVDALAGLGYEGAVDVLCDGLGQPDPAAEAVSPPAFDTAGLLAARGGDAAARQAAGERARAERRGLVLWWVRRMVVAERPLREKLTFLWHDHFATSLGKVQLAELLHRQHRTLYELGAGRFDELVSAVTRDPAMLVWLDGRTSTGRAPNENYARELFELFTLGHGSGHHAEAYGETDIAEAARALTGWVIDPATVSGAFVPRRHDAGSKTVLGTTGALDADGVVDAATSHPACAPHVVATLWSGLVAPAGPDDPTVVELARGFAADLDVGGLLRRILLHPAFLAQGARTALVKTPVEYVVGTCRALRITPDERILAVLHGLGQIPFAPPDVDGWPANEAWLSTSSALVRLQFATAVAGNAVGPGIDALADAAPADRPSVAARVLGVDRWGGATAAALRSAGDARTALILALVAPEHLLA